MQCSFHWRKGVKTHWYCFLVLTLSHYLFGFCSTFSSFWACCFSTLSSELQGSNSFTTKIIFLQMPIHEQLASRLVVQSWLSFNRRCSYPSKRGPKRRHSRKSLQLQSTRATSRSVKCSQTAFSIPTSSWLQSPFSFPPVAATHSLKRPHCECSITKSWSALFYRGVWDPASSNLNLSPNPEFLPYLHGNTVPSSSCPKPNNRSPFHDVTACQV